MTTTTKTATRIDPWLAATITFIAASMAYVLSW